MQYMLLRDKQSLAFYLDDITEGLKKVAKKNAGFSVQHTLNLMIQNVEFPNTFLMIAEHRKRCVGLLFGVAVIADTKFIEIIALWSLPKLATRVKHEAFDHLRKWCKDREITAVLTNITRGITPHKHAPNGVYTEWLNDLGFEEVGKVMRMRV